MERPLVGLHIEAYPFEDSKLNIYNRNTGKTYVLGEKESRVFQSLNGANTLDEIQQKCPFYTYDEVEKLISAFAEIGFFETKKKKFNPLKIKLRLFNPNKLLSECGVLTRILHYGIIIGCPLLLVLGIIMLRTNISDPNTYVSEIILAFEGLKLIDGIVIVLLALLCLSLHEFAHMITARKYGVNVPEIGIMLYFLVPCAYTNITGINLLQSKGKRMVVLLSGSLVNLGLIGACCIVMSLSSSPIIGLYGAILMLVNIGTIFMNTMVFLKFDGYYMLETILNEPKLREKALAHSVGYLKLIFSRNKEAKQTFTVTIKESSSLLLHITYCVYSVMSIAYVPFVLLNTVIPFFA